MSKFNKSNKQTWQGILTKADADRWRENEEAYWKMTQAERDEFYTLGRDILKVNIRNQIKKARKEDELDK